MPNFSGLCSNKVAYEVSSEEANSEGDLRSPDEFEKSLSKFTCPEEVPCIDVSPLHDNDKECPICLEDMEKPYITNCNHKYCLECITRLITSSHTKTTACPLCRQEVTLRTIQSFGPEKKKGVVSRILNKKPKGLLITRVDV